MRTLALFALFAALAAAQGPPSGPPPPDGPKQPVSGRVVDAETGQPVRGAQVVLAEGRNELVSTYSGADGRFRIEEAPVGEWRLSIAKPSYAYLFDRLVVPSAQPVSDLELEIHRYGVIAGRALDRRNRPVAGARVVVLTPQLEDGEAVLREAGRGRYGAQTDDRGEFRVWGLSPGPYLVGVYPGGSPAAAGALRFASAGGFYPNAASLAEAERIQVGWGEVREGLELRLGEPPETRAVIQAVLPGGGEAWCETCSVVILLEDPQALVRIADARLGAGNSLVVEGLPLGRYKAHLRAFDRATSSMQHGTAALDLTTPVPDPVPVTAFAEAPVRGRIVLEDRPEEQMAKPFRGGLRATPPMRMRNLGVFTRGMFANVQIDGTDAPFELTCFPGEIRLELTAGGDAYVAGITLDGKPLDSPLLQIPPEGIPEGLVLRVRFDAGLLEGSLETPRAPAAGGLSGPEYALVARPVEGERAFRGSRYVRVLPNGTFRQSMPPGRYDLVAFRAGQRESLLTDPSREAEVRRITRRVEIEPNETTSVTLPTASGP